MGRGRVEGLGSGKEGRERGRENVGRSRARGREESFPTFFTSS